MKSARLLDEWQRKRDRAAADGEPLTKSCPAWLEVVDGRFAERPAAVAVVRRMFRMSADGVSSEAIVQTLNGEGVPPIGSAPHWSRSYVALIL